MENPHSEWICPLKVVIFHIYVKLPEGILFVDVCASYFFGWAFGFVLFGIYRSYCDGELKIIFDLQCLLVLQHAVTAMMLA